MDIYGLVNAVISQNFTGWMYYAELYSFTSSPFGYQDNGAFFFRVFFSAFRAKREKRRSPFLLLRDPFFSPEDSEHT